MKKNQPILIILAGGKSSRMGTPKGLLPFKDSYWILSQIEKFTIGDCIYIGLGFDSQLYFDAIPWLEKAIESPQVYQNKKIQVVINSTPEFGFFSTLQAVLKVIHNSTELSQEVLITPIDVPIPNKETLETINSIDNHIVIPKFEQKNGHPVKLQASFWHQLLDLEVKNSRLDIEIKKINTEQVTKVSVRDQNCLLNLNTPEEWNEFIRKKEEAV